MSVNLQLQMMVEFFMATSAIKCVRVREPKCTKKMTGLSDGFLQTQAVREDYQAHPYRYRMLTSRSPLSLQVLTSTAPSQPQHPKVSLRMEEPEPNFRVPKIWKTK